MGAGQGEAAVRTTAGGHMLNGSCLLHADGMAACPLSRLILYANLPPSCRAHVPSATVLTSLAGLFWITERSRGPPDPGHGGHTEQGRAENAFFSYISPFLMQP
ncbi:hypothetical protein L7F22_047016 [Adiantum nelumboides]|nr:hypothetical protein [Adiantum nelumboides]